MTVRDSLSARLEAAAAAVGSTLDDGQRPAADALAAAGARLLRRRPTRPRRPRWVYLFGDVGRGKTWLVDGLLAGLAADLETDAVLRVHAFDAARRLHAAVARASGEPAPLRRALDELLGPVRVLFLDELHAHDPGDAMILARLVRDAVGRGAVLLATSNYAPSGLLPSPRFHHLVQPLVACLEEACTVVEVAAGPDYRRLAPLPDRPGWSSGAWVVPGSAAQAARLGLTTPGPADRTFVSVGGRRVAALAVEDDAVHLHFADACEAATSVADLLALADRYPALVLWAVPRLTRTTPDAARRFANLVDVCWDRDTRLVVLASDPPDDVLDTPLLDRARTASRLAALARN